MENQETALEMQQRQGKLQHNVKHVNLMSNVCVTGDPEGQEREAERASEEIMAKKTNLVQIPTLI